MSFLNDFENVFTEADNAPTLESSTAAKDSSNAHADFFDREDEPVIW